MGNITSMGYGSTAADAGMAGENGAMSHSVSDYIQRLPPDELQRYTEGYRRICRVEAPSPSNGGALQTAGRSSSASSLPPVSATAAATTRRASNASQVAVAEVRAPTLPSGAALTKKVFRQKVLSAFPMIPTSLADRLFDVLDTRRTGALSCDDVLSGIAWLKHGTFDEQVRLLFRIYDLDSTGLVTRDVLDRFMDVVYGRKRARASTTVAFLDAVFDGRTSLTLDEFARVVRASDANGAALLLEWLSVLADTIGAHEDAAILALERSYNPAVIRQRLAAATQFAPAEITALERQFVRLFDTAKTGAGSSASGSTLRVAATAFVSVLSDNALFPRRVLERACAHRDIVTLDDLCRFMSDCCRGDIEARQRHLFALFQDLEPATANTETTDAATTNAVPANSVPAAEVTMSWDAVDELCAIGCACAADESVATLTEREQSCVAQLKRESAGARGLTESRFLAWATSAAAVRHVLDQLAFAACILFGVKPESPQLERRIVEWHWSHATVSFSVGETWNLVGAAWWQQWCQYVGMSRLNGTPSGALPLPVIPNAARALVGRGDLIAATATSDKGTRPGPVANWDLLHRSGSRRLKDRLVFGRDFYLVPSTAYAVLVLWYSGGPDLARTIIEHPPGRLEIELFPLVLRVARVDPANGSVIMSGAEVLLSALSTPASVLEATCRALLLLKSLDKARLWYFDEREPANKHRVRIDRPNALARLAQDCVVLLEVQDDDGSWPLSQATDSVAAAASSRVQRSRDGHGDGSDDDDDVSGDDDDDVSDSDGDAAASPSRDRHRTTSSRRKRPRDQRPLSRTSDICSRGNLETLTTLGGVYKSSSRSDTTTGESSTDTSATTSTIDAAPTSALSPERARLAAARTVVRKRFSKDAFTGHGLVGLDNLGNTCYMSSALQCLSHTPLLVSYFRHEAYLRDINVRNRDGTNGQLAVAFGELLRVLWTSEKKRFAPTAFKRVIAKCHPQFTGTDQHDAQELLACLLSGLSEDLNRVMVKPYAEQPDSAGRSDAVVAAEWWRNHLARERSVIVALFTGQYKSLLECSVCRYESARFEPFTFLQLSLPESSVRSLVLTVIFRCGRVPLKLSVRVPHSATVQDVRREVAQLLCEVKRGDRQSNTAVTADAVQLVETQLVLARISVLHTVDTLLDGRTPLTHVHEKDQLAVFELDDVAPRPDAQQQQQHTSAAKRSAGASDSKANAATVPSPAPASTGANGSASTHTDPSTRASELPHMNGVAAAEASTAVSDALFPVGASVFVRADRTKDVASARVLGSSAASNTVDVAFPSGARRYSVAASKVVARLRDVAYVYLVHRRVERSTSCFTNAHVTRLFGAPLVLRVSLHTTTPFELYVAVWRRLRRIFNWQTPPAASDFDDLEVIDRSDGDSSNGRMRSDASTLALGRHLGITKFGFCLRLVTAQGTGCSRCEWLAGCLGCLICPSTQAPLALSAEETIAIDWDIRTLKDAYDPGQASQLDVDDSVERHQQQDNAPLSIERCMDMFTANERIAEAFCSRCRTLRPATKTMDLWRLPPLLVIQLKRFCYTQVARRKLHHLVDFPLRGLTLEAFVAKQRQPTRLHESGLQYWQFLGGRLACLESADSVDGHDSGSVGLADCVDTVNGSRLHDRHTDDSSSTSNSDTASSSASPPSTPLRPTPVLDAPATAEVRGADGFVYDLYAVVNHVGALGAGHYFAYVLSETDNKWKCFNDHQCKDMDAHEVVSATAYILFYRRRDLQDAAIEELYPPLATKASVGNSSSSSDDRTGSRSADDDATVEQLLEQSKLASAGGSSCVIS